LGKWLFVGNLVFGWLSSTWGRERTFERMIVGMVSGRENDLRKSDFGWSLPSLYRDKGERERERQMQQRTQIEIV